MAIVKLNTRLMQKYDTEENWGKASGFIPLKGEKIIYAPDGTHPYVREKTGDGVTAVTALPFDNNPNVIILDGYVKPDNTSAITNSDTLNGAVGKLEKAFDNTYTKEEQDTKYSTKQETANAAGAVYSTVAKEYSTKNESNDNTVYSLEAAKEYVDTTAQRTFSVSGHRLVISTPMGGYLGEKTKECVFNQVSLDNEGNQVGGWYAGHAFGVPKTDIIKIIVSDTPYLIDEVAGTRDPGLADSRLPAPYKWYGNEFVEWLADDGTYEITCVVTKNYELVIRPSRRYAKMYLNPNSSNMFAGFTNVTEIIGLNLLDTSKVTNMSYMFSGCTSLKHVDISSWDMSKVTNMSYMFNGCNSLKYTDVSKWNLQSANIMEGIFFDCYALSGINVSRWNIANATNIMKMFFNCRSLTELEVGSWNTEKVTQMHALFGDCWKLKTVNVTNWNVSNAKDMSAVFYDCIALESVDVSKWKVTTAQQQERMFYHCHNLSELNFGEWDTTKVSNMSEMFKECYRLQTVTLGPEFTFKGEDSYLPKPDSTYIPGATGNWEDKANPSTSYTPAQVAAGRTSTITYVAEIQQ